jgi:hypothetical protein
LHCPARVIHDLLNPHECLKLPRPLRAKSDFHLLPFFR